MQSRERRTPYSQPKFPSKQYQLTNSRHTHTDLQQPKSEKQKDSQILESILARVRRIKQQNQTQQKIFNTIQRLPGVRGKLDSPVEFDIQDYYFRATPNLLVQSTSNSIILKNKMVSLFQNQPSKAKFILQQLHKNDHSNFFTKTVYAEMIDIMQSQKNNADNQKLLRTQLLIKPKRFVKQPKAQTNIYHEFVSLLNWSNNISHGQVDSNRLYRAYVQKGNNHQLVKNTLRRRFWWNVLDHQPETIMCDLVWTQNRNLKFILTLNKQQLVPDIQSREVTLSNAKLAIPLLSSRQVEKFIDKNKLKPKPNLKSVPNQFRIHNHLEFNSNLSNKKKLFSNLHKYYVECKIDPFSCIPTTFHITQLNDDQWNIFKEEFELNTHKVWIVKPGENTNRGNGITVCNSLQQIESIITKNTNKKMRTFIVQRYLVPFLYNNRKFDIRTYVLVTSVAGCVKGYWYQQGYIRTSSKQFSLNSLNNKIVHLTNDAIQNKSEDYGKYQPANKISFQDFQKYLDKCFPQFNFKLQIQPRMMNLAADALKSTYRTLDSNQRQYSFQIFGLDFMIDCNFKVWLIEFNTNPCLELPCTLLSNIIPNMLENALRIAVDPMLLPPKEWPKQRIVPDVFEENRFVCIFDSDWM